MSNSHIDKNGHEFITHFTQDNFLDPEISIKYIGLEHLAHWNLNSLTAPFWRIYYNTAGTCSLYFPNREHPEEILEMKPNTVYLIPPDTDYATKAKDVDHFYIHFTARPPYYQIKENWIKIENHSALYSLIPSVSSASRLNSIHPNHLSLLAISIASTAISTIHPSSLIHNISDQRISQVMEIIEKNFPQITPKEEMAKLVKMNTNALSRLFKTHTGTTIQDYLIHLRMSLAGDLLLYTEKDINDIAQEVGYCDRFQFSKAFKKVKNISPVKYRKQIT